MSPSAYQKVEQDHKALSVVDLTSLSCASTGVISRCIRSAENEIEILMTELHSDSKVMLVGDVEDGWNDSAKSPSSVRHLEGSTPSQTTKMLAPLE